MNTSFVFMPFFIFTVKPVKSLYFMQFTKGILLLISQILIFFSAYKYYKNSCYTRTLMLIILGGAILRLWCILDPFLYAWDERYHALVAKNLSENPFLPLLYKTPVLPYNFQNWAGNHIWLHKQPMALWLMALSIKIFGCVEWAVRLPSLLMSIASIFVTFKISSFYSNVKVGLLAAFFQSVNGLIIELASGRESTDHIDTAFLFFIELSVYCIIQFSLKKHSRYIWQIGFFLGISILTKWLTALIIVPVFIILTFPTEGWLRTILNVLKIVIIAICVALPWQLYINYQFPKEAAWESHFNWLHLTQVIEGHSGEWWWYLAYAMKYWNEFIIIAFLWFLLHSFKTYFNNKHLSLVIWIAIPYIFFSSVATKMVAYPVITVPAVFTVLSMFWWYFIEFPLSIRWLNQLILIAIIVLSVRCSYERLRLFRDDTVSTEKVNWIKNLNEIIKEPNVIIFNMENNIETMFYTPFIAYDFTPNDIQIEDLKNKGYQVYIKEGENLIKK